MAYTKTPSNSTYETKIIKLMKEVNTRNATPASNDEDYKNVYFEVIKNKVTGENDQYIVKRAGTETFGSSSASEVRGMFYWEDQQRLYVAIGADLVYYNVATGVIGATYAAFFSGSTGKVGFEEFLFDTNTSSLVVTDGTVLKTIDAAGTITTSSSPDLPTPHDTNIIFLDGYLFMLKVGTADIYNSNLNDPLAFTAGDFITAEMNPDTAKTLAKLNNYLVVLGSSSVEYFWDAAEESGSPMRRNDTPVKNTGYLGGLATFGQRVFFVGNENESEPAIFMLEDFRIIKLSTEAVGRYLASLTESYEDYYMSFMSFNGNDFMVLNAGDYTYVMNLNTRLWTRFAFQTGTSFPVKHTANCKTDSAYYTILSLTTTGQLYKMSASLYQDDSVDFECLTVTPSNEFDTMNQKFAHRLTIWADRPRATSTIDVSWSDDDYQTWSTAREINLNAELPSITQLGRFRSRAFKFSYTDNYPMRVKQVELDINKGQT